MKESPLMTSQLQERYGDAVHSVNLCHIHEPIRVDFITVKDKIFKALYFGKMDLTEVPGYKYMEFWHLEDAYEFFKDKERTGEIFPYMSYPMRIATGQVILIRYVKKDGSSHKNYLRADGFI